MEKQVAPEDYVAICQLKARYCRLLDTRDWGGWAQLFTEDYRLDVRGSGGELIEGRDAAMASVRKSLEGAKTAHQVHPPEVEVDGDEAQAIFAMQDRVVWEGRASLTGYGHYTDRLRRTPDGWRIAAVSLTRVLMEFEQAETPA